MQFAAAAQHNRLIKAKENIINKFAMNPATSCRSTTKVARLILLNGPYLLKGSLYDVKSKSLGAGVYELRLERVND